MIVVILGIESSCDETAAAVVRDGRSLLSSVIASQVDLHARFGGVVPEIASRHHIEAVAPVILQALDDAGVSLAEIEGIAVTRGDAHCYRQHCYSGYFKRQQVRGNYKP